MTTNVLEAKPRGIALSPAVPSDAVECVRRAKEAARKGQWEEAAAAWQEALQLFPQSADLHGSYGLSLARLGRSNEAVAAYREALRIKPDIPEVANNLAIVLQQQGSLEEAVSLLRTALVHRPDSAETHSNLGVALAGQGKLDEAIASYQDALRLVPDSPEALNNLGNCLRNRGQVEEAVSQFHKALRLKSDYAEAYNNLGICYLHLHQLKDAIASYDRALALKPEYAEAHLNRALALLAGGHWEEGWREYEWRRRGKDAGPRTFTQPAWDGSSPAGRTILLHTEQGLGDTFQFMRYAVLIQKRGGRVILECPASLKVLLRGCAGVDQLVAHTEPLPPFDMYAPLASLPRLFNTTLTTVPAPVPYLTAPEERRRRWATELRGIRGFKVGINWQGNPRYRGDRHRSVALAHFAPLVELRGVQLLSLQKGTGQEQLAALKGCLPILDLGSRLDQESAFLDTAAVLLGLDLLVTSDTAVAHLAGALGVPVWVVLPHTPDWRWLREREDSPWYPTMRLFRQPRRGDWETVFARVAEEICKRLGRGLPPLQKTLVATQAETCHRRGVECLGEGRTTDAVASMRAALRLRPLRADWHHNLGVALASSGKPAEAVFSFRDALRLKPAADTWNNLGLALLELGRLAEAANCFRDGLRLQPSAAELHNHLGVCLVRQGQLDEAVRCYLEALQISPQSADVHNNLGNALRLLGRTTEALPPLQAALALKPDSVDIHHNLGLALAQLGQREAAVDRFRQAVAREPGRWDVWTSLGVTLEELGHEESAMDCFEKVLALHPKDSLASTRLTALRGHFRPRPRVAVETT